MALLSTLPEILQIIVAQSGVKTLKALRLTNRLLSSSATKYLFLEISLYPDDMSCQAFDAILTHPQLKDHVHKVYLNTVEVDYESNDAIDGTEPLPNWQKLLEMLPNLSNLESVALRFDKNCAKDPDWFDAPQTDEYRATLLRWLSTGLASLRQPLKELELWNHQNVTLPSDEFEQVMTTLQTLRLNVVHELVPHCPEEEIDLEEVSDFYGKILPSVWLKPTMASLRKLSLCSSFYWGFYPKLSLEGIYFPSLQSLALGNFTFFQDEQLNWIISHGSTLKELYLDDCPILSHVRILDYQENSGKCPLPASEMQLAREEDRGDSWLYDYPRQWSEYFASFEGGLGCLRHFAIGSSEKWNFTHGLPFGMEKDLQPVLLESRYSSFDGGQIRRNIGEKNWLKRYGEDREALKSLYRKITQQ